MKLRYEIKILALLFLAFCLFHALGFFHHLLDPNNGYAAEREIGTLAKDLKDGLLAPIVEYQTYDRTTGQLAMGFVLYPLYLVFGDNYAVNVAVSALISFFIMYGWFVFFRRYQSPIEAWIIAALFLVPPLLYFDYTMISFGNHKESALCAIVMILLLFRIFETNKNIKLSIVLGVISGLASYFCFQNLITLASILLLWLFYRPKSMLIRELGAFALGFSCSLGPILAWYLSYSYNFFGHLFLNSDPGFSQSTLVKLFNLFTIYLPKMFAPSVIGLLISLIFWGMFGWLVFYYKKSITIYLKNTCSSKRDVPPMPVAMASIVFIPCYIAAYGSTGYGIQTTDTYGLRYLIPLYPFVFAVIALAIAKVGKKMGYKLSAALILLWLIPTFVFNTVVQVRDFLDWQSPMCRIISYKGYNYSAFMNSQGGLPRVLDNIPKERFYTDSFLLVESVSSDYRWKAFEMVGYTSARRFHNSIILSQPIPEKYVEFFLRGWGYGLMLNVLRDPDKYKDISNENFHKITKIISENEKAIQWIWTGVGMAFSDEIFSDAPGKNILIELKKRWDLDADKNPEYILGFIPQEFVPNLILGAVVASGNAMTLQHLPADPDTKQISYAIGYAFAENTIFNFTKIPKKEFHNKAVIENLPPNTIKDYYRGINDGFAKIGIEVIKSGECFSYHRK